MDRSIYFCKSWFRAKKRPTEIWSEDQAKEAHANKQCYTVLVDSAEQPYCFLEISEKAVGVSFLDENLRESLSYDFQEMSPGKLFLTMATHREFVGDTDKVSSGTSYIFNQDGSVRVRRELFVPEHKLESSSSSIDIESNYARMPLFGEYDDLIRVERR